MRPFRAAFILGFCILFCLAACSPAASPTAAPTQAESAQVLLEPTVDSHKSPLAGQEVPVQLIELAGTATLAEREFSGLAWYGDNLILLPQYPDNTIYSITKADLLTYLDTANPTPIQPQEIAFSLSSPLTIPTFQGYEALEFIGDTAYLTIETGGGTHSYLISGTMSASGLVLDTASLMELPQPMVSVNQSYESLLNYGGILLALYELNGTENPQAVAQLIPPQLRMSEAFPMPTIPYRITDASEVDSTGRFWVINYLFPNDGQRLADDPYSAYSLGATHNAQAQVERLIELQIGDTGISIVEQAPLYLELSGDVARNWEGLVRLDQRGFLIVTDKFPTTLLGFVPFGE